MNSKINSHLWQGKESDAQAQAAPRKEYMRIQGGLQLIRVLLNFTELNFVFV